VVGDQREGSSVQVDPVMLNCPDGRKTLSVIAAVILLISIATARSIRDHIFVALVVSLDENGAQPNGTPVGMDFKRAAVIRPPEDRGLGQLDLQLLKGLLACLVPVYAALSWSSRCSGVQMWEHFSMNSRLAHSWAP
jgi:hypothetical protein